jgi:hypothetical protein
MTEQVQRFDVGNATAEALREEARDVEDVAATILMARDRGHFDSAERVDALKVVSYLRTRAAELRASARLREGPMKGAFVS